jgi:hypothetical protein
MSMQPEYSGRVIATSARLLLTTGCPFPQQTSDHAKGARVPSSGVFSFSGAFCGYPLPPAIPPEQMHIVQTSYEKEDQLVQRAL